MFERIFRAVHLGECGLGVLGELTQASERKEAKGGLVQSGVRFYFDPLCPWAYRASQWIREVRKRVGIQVEWRFFSLEVVNAADPEPSPFERDWAPGWAFLRAAAWLRQAHSVSDANEDSNSAVDRFYARLGEAIHDRGISANDRRSAEELVEHIGYPRSLLGDALSDPDTERAVMRDHREAVERYGAFGVPTLVLPSGNAVFGPAIVSAPRGEEAVDLWNLLLSFDAMSFLYELKRPAKETSYKELLPILQPWRGAASVN